LELLDSFHFARPWALLFIPIVILQVLWYLRFRHASNPWQDRMRADLQQQLLAKPKKQPSYLLWTLIALILTGFAVAGPSWSQQSRPVLSKQDNLVIVLDLSLSMLAEDSQPNRITRSKQKLHDLLKQRKEGMTALVVYSGNAYTVTPLTQDTATIRNLLPALDPLMMPQLGSAAEYGVEKALTLVKQSGFQKARLLLITDGLDESAQKAIRKQLPKGVKLSLMVVGTQEGAPIPLSDQGFVKDQQGNVIISQVNFTVLNQFAQSVGALIHPITLNNQDLEQLLPKELDQQQIKEEKAQVPLWVEQGHWFLLPVLPLAALAFRRNWLMLIPLLLLLPLPKPAYALWEEAPQIQGEQAFEQGKYQEAEQLLQDPLWLGSAHYRQKDYAAAASEFAKSDSPQAHYNRGNALAKLGRFDEAIAAYSLALEKEPQLKDAQTNREIVEELLKKQQKSQDSEQQSQQQKQQQSQQQQSSQKEESADQQNNQEAQQSDKSQQSGQSAESQSGQSQNQGSEFGANKPNPSVEDAPSESDHPENRASDSAEHQSPSQDQAKNQAQNQALKNQASSTQQPMSEEELSLEQWLRRVPDDPAGLLRRKFEFEAIQRQQALPEGRSPW